MKIDKNRFKTIMEGTALSLTGKEILIRHIAYDAERRGADPIRTIQQSLPEVQIVDVDIKSRSLPSDRGPKEIGRTAAKARSSAEKASDTKIPEIAKFTPDQQAFLDRHEIPASAVFDATGMRRSRYQWEMEQEEKIIATGVSPCRNYGHTMRTRAGHCVQCSPANIEYIKRHFRDASVYVAGSIRSKLIKVGSASAPDVRIKLLNERSYGSISDWRLLSHVRCDNSGKAEFDIHRRLSSFAISRSYLREGAVIECREIFSCGYNTAHQAMNDVLGAQAMLDVWEHKDARAVYDFADRRL